MSSYLIATSSTCDLTRDYLDAHGVPFISYSYTVGGQPFEDDCREDSRAKVYQGMRNGDLLKTSMISEYAYQEFFRSLLETGKDVLFLDMSQKMSVSYVNSVHAAEAVRKEFPGRQLYVMDTRCISGGLGLLVRNAVDNLKYLKAGGRVSNFAALVGTMLSIKPVLYVPDAGTLDVVEKVRGRRAALGCILKSVLKDLESIDCTGLEFDINHADCLKDAEYIRDEIMKAHPEVGKISITGLGVVIGAHCGPGLLTVFYLCGGRKP